MATLIGEYGADHSRFHHSIIAPGLPYQQQHSHESRFRSHSRPRIAPARSLSAGSPQQPNPAQSQPGPSAAGTASAGSSSAHDGQQTERDGQPSAADSYTYRPASDVSRFPTPPDSASPGPSHPAEARSQHGQSPPSMESPQATQGVSEPSSTSSTVTVIPATSASRLAQQVPSPQSEGDNSGTQPKTAPPISQADAPRSQKTIHITDLAHIQKLAQLDLVTATGPGILNDPPLQDMKFEISAMPIGDIIEMVAALLTKITTTNDLQHDALNRNATHQRQAQAQSDGSESYASPFSSSVLAFHGKNVPAITILSYLSRIHKYCPTTYEVFLSLLVYFDRMTERVNDLVVKDEADRDKARPSAGPDPDTVMADDNSDSDEVDEDLADSDDDNNVEDERPSKERGASPSGKAASGEAGGYSATYFVVDSFNIHRLIIAGVTCASKFFSDVFYTNSRYAKVGGLPLAELNHLELQFLLLNDFRLAVPVEDLEAYATMLVEFYAREVVSQRSRPAAGSSSTDA